MENSSRFKVLYKVKFHKLSYPLNVMVFVVREWLKVEDYRSWKVNEVNWLYDMLTSMTKHTFSHKVIPSLIIFGDMQGLNSHCCLESFFRIRLFLVCSIVGLLVLLPLNYTGSNGPNTSSHSMDAFTISNISRGSDRLCSQHFLISSSWCR